MAKTDEVTRKEQESMKEFTIKINNTVTTQLGTQEKQDVRERKAASPKEPQNTSQHEPSETAGALSIWSVCLIVASVCFVCQALSIYAPRGEANTTIDFVMFSSPLDGHKGLHTWINE